MDIPQCTGEQVLNSNSNLMPIPIQQLVSDRRKYNFLTAKAHISLSPVDFKLVTLCTMPSIVPLTIPPAFLATHLPSLCSLMPGSSSLCTCSENQIKKRCAQTQMCSPPFSISAARQYTSGIFKVQKVWKRKQNERTPQ